MEYANGKFALRRPFPLMRKMPKLGYLDGLTLKAWQKGWYL
jgi:hypothetical protein